MVGNTPVFTDSTADFKMLFTLMLQKFIQANDYKWKMIKTFQRYILLQKNKNTDFVKKKFAFKMQSLCDMSRIK